MENKTNLKHMGILVLTVVLALSAIILVGLISKFVSQDAHQYDAKKLEDTHMPETTTTLDDYTQQTTTSTLTSSTTTTTIKNLRITDGPKPQFKGDLENNLGRFFINKTVVFNDSSGVNRVAGVVRQLYEIDEEEIDQYDGEEIYIQYWNGTWAVYKRG